MSDQQDRTLNRVLALIVLFLIVVFSWAGYQDYYHAPKFTVTLYSNGQPVQKWEHQQIISSEYHDRINLTPAGVTVAGTYTIEAEPRK